MVRERIVTDSTNQPLANFSLIVASKKRLLMSQGNVNFKTLYRKSKQLGPSRHKSLIFYFLWVRYMQWSDILLLYASSIMFQICHGPKHFGEDGII